MIKSLIRPLISSSAILGIIATSVIGSSLVSSRALALPEEQVIEKLNSVPVFTIADENGVPLVASPKAGEGDAQASEVFIFISQEDANNLFERLQTQDPDLASKVKVIPLPLSEVYKLSQQNPDDGNLNFVYVPNETAVSDAETVSGDTYQGGVPLFVAKRKEGDGFLTIEQNSEQVVPFFFEKQQLENMLENFKTQQPDLASTVNIEVVLLESVLQTLETSEDQFLTKIFLVPSKESVSFIQQSAPLPEGEAITPEGEALPQEEEATPAAE